MGSGIPNMWLFVTPLPWVTWHGACALPQTLYNEEVQSINLSYVEFANKTTNIKCKKLISLQYPVRATKPHIQNSRNHFARIMWYSELTARHFTPFYLLHWLSPKQITVVYIGGYQQPKHVLVYVTVSFTFKFSNNFDCRSGHKVNKKMSMGPSEF